MADCKSRTWGKWWSSGGSVHLLRSFAISSAKCGWWGEDSIYLLNSTTRGGGGRHHHHQHWHHHVERWTPPPEEVAVVIIVVIIITNIDIIIATDQLNQQRRGRSSSSSEAAWTSTLTSALRRINYTTRKGIKLVYCAWLNKGLLCLYILKKLRFGQVTPIPNRHTHRQQSIVLLSLSKV